jgi:RNA polymerase sigma factor (TIGR02999 family)
MEGEPGEITGLLGKLSSGQAEVSARLIELVYKELRSIAGRCMQRERPGHTLQPTVLVHDVYLRPAAETGIRWQSRAHFFGFAAQIMRRVLLDYAREHRAIKRGGAGARISLDEAFLITDDQLDKVLILDESLQKLAAVDPQQARIVEFRFFAGMRAFPDSYARKTNAIAHEQELVAYWSALNGDPTGASRTLG